MMQLMRFDAKVAVVTGGGSGIGQATAERIADEGGRVAIVDIDGAAAEVVATSIRANGGEAVAFSYDIADRAAYARAVDEITDQLGPVDVLVNNAAIGGVGRLESWDEAAFRRVIDVNVLGVLHGISLLGPRMVKQGSGAIVNITSMAAEYGLAGLTPYTISKGGVSALTRSAAMELAPHVRVNAVAPGKIITPFRERMFGAALTDREIAEIAATYPLRRVGNPEDIAAAVAFLGSDDAAFVTGVILSVDGGRTVGSPDLW
jgi:NAD(P)-dependent dehydrogenase (short-subunit alcohol dehydrogenase family)